MRQIGVWYPYQGTPTPWEVPETVPYNSANHSISHKRGRDGKYHSGGNWYMFKCMTSSTDSQQCDLTYRFSRYIGRFTARNAFLLGHPNWNLAGLQSVAGGDWETVSGRTAVEQKLDGMGSAAYNRLRPDAPSFDSALNLLELKDVPRMLKQTCEGALAVLRFYERRSRHGLKNVKYYVDPRDTSRSVGEYTLLALFGYLPLISAVRDFWTAYSRLDRDLRRVCRLAERPVRRYVGLDSDTVTFSQDTNFSSTEHGLWCTLAPNTYFGPSGKVNQRAIYSYRTWAEGKFRMILPKLPDGRVDMVKLTRRMMGSRVTLSTLYNLMPWSWLVDYFTDLGQFVEAISPGVADNVYCEYFYIMRDMSYSYDMTVNAKLRNGNPVDFTYSNRRACKVRRSATRFGFGISQSMLTPKQLAILGALGLSKL